MPKKREGGEVVLGCLIVGFVVGFFLVIILVDEYRKNKPGVLEVQVNKREIERAGEEDKVIDNRGSAQPVNWTLNVDNNWRTEYTIAEENLRQATTRLGIPLDPLVAEVGTSIQKNLSVSHKETKESQRKDTLTVQVPSRSLLNICLTWKNVWQLGIVKVRLNSRENVEVPFRVLEERQFEYRTGRCAE